MDQPQPQSADSTTGATSGLPVAASGNSSQQSQQQQQQQSLLQTQQQQTPASSSLTNSGGGASNSSNTNGSNGPAAVVGNANFTAAGQLGAAAAVVSVAVPGRSARLSACGVGARVIRGPDWKWGKQVNEVDIHLKVFFFIRF